MVTPAGIQQLVAEFYEAAFESGLWERAFADLCSATRSTSIVITTSNTEFKTLSRPYTYNLSLAAWKVYLDDLLAICPRFQYMRQAKPAVVFHDHCHSSDIFIGNSEYYALLEQHWGTRYYMAKLLPLHDCSVAHVSLHRKASDGHYQMREIQLLETIAPHLSRALQLNTSLNLPESAGAFPGKYRCNEASAIILDSNAVPIYIGSGVAKIIGCADGFSISSGTLVTSFRSDQVKLQSLIRLAIRATNTNTQSQCSAMSLHKKSGGRPYKVVVKPLSRDGNFYPILDAAVAVYLIDPDDFALPDIHYLAQLYGFTPMETRLISKFIESGSLPKSAAGLGVSKNTGRVHLQSIFKKTSVSSQAELIKLLLHS